MSLIPKKVSTLRRKQRKMLYTSTGDARIKHVSSQFSKDLRKEHGIKRAVLAVNDVVEITVGKFKGKTGKVVEINYEKMKAYVEDCTVNRSTGGTAQVPFDASNFRIIELAMDEKRAELFKKELERINRVKARFAA